MLITFGGKSQGAESFFQWENQGAERLFTEKIIFLRIIPEGDFFTIDFMGIVHIYPMESHCPVIPLNKKVLAPSFLRSLEWSCCRRRKGRKIICTQNRSGLCNGKGITSAYQNVFPCFPFLAFEELNIKMKEAKNRSRRGLKTYLNTPFQIF